MIIIWNTKTGERRTANLAPGQPICLGPDEVVTESHPEPQAPGKVRRTYVADLRPGWHEWSGERIHLVPEAEAEATKPDGHHRIRITLDLPEHHRPVDTVVPVEVQS